ncbi:hypothetical protein CLOSTASPAR_03226 [[Clostridium] asparagiforme DSM 15981]|uniref:Uncharacterized protein n=1 Tax=[Clostridium] asparagiforme DSM 15981 TaxID=518636 RepID=C0D1T7_9FIRM|nr:hypothetical protein CLOSTASPAR_03226 [[Clostridium] asparagiforme DSM 15981]
MIPSYHKKMELQYFFTKKFLISKKFCIFCLQMPVTGVSIGVQGGTFCLKSRDMNGRV